MLSRPQYSPDLGALQIVGAGRCRTRIADPEQWLFLDTETTGLAGGSGTYAFLVGIAWWEGGGLEIEQFFMREYSEERALLFALRERIAEHPVLVTFNGKVIRLAAARNPLSYEPEDFCADSAGASRFPSSRTEICGDFASGRSDCQNLNVTCWAGTEERIFSPVRSHKSISIILRGGPPERLVPVLNHNQMDLRGLAALSSRILSLLSDAENLGQDGLELFGVSRICEKRGERTRARNALREIDRIVSCPAKQIAQPGGHWRRLAKREGDFELACELWKGALGNSRHGYEAYEQLAIYYEHKARDPEQARQIVRQAVDELRRAIQTGEIAPGAYREIKARFDHRLERLERKSRKPLLDALAPETRA